MIILCLFSWLAACAIAFVPACLFSACLLEEKKTNGHLRLLVSNRLSWIVWLSRQRFLQSICFFLLLLLFHFNMQFHFYLFISCLVPRSFSIFMCHKIAWNTHCETKAPRLPRHLSRHDEWFIALEIPSLALRPRPPIREQQAVYPSQSKCKEAFSCLGSSWRHIRSRRTTVEECIHHDIIFEPN